MLAKSAFWYSTMVCEARLDMTVGQMWGNPAKRGKADGTVVAEQGINDVQANLLARREVVEQIRE
jgi:hypothetical protein